MFDDVEVELSGRLELSYPYFDYWDVPWPIGEADEEPQRRAIRLVEGGALLDWREADVQQHGHRGTDSA